MQPSYCYSPLEIGEYRLTALSHCEVSGIMSLTPAQGTAVWNLMWLSVPTVDSLPVHGKTPNWFRYYQPTPGAARAITADAIADEALFRKLQLHPSRFISFFERENHGIYDCYTALGGEAWVQTVLSRAEMSARHMASSLPEDIRNNTYAFPQRS